MEESLPIRSSLPRRGRLIKSASYGVVLSSRGPKTVRLSSRWLTLTALLKPESETGERLRFGFTVGKANAHRGVNRVLVKRILRESARLSKPALAQSNVCADVVLRLKCRLPKLGEDVVLGSFKQELRRDCDELLLRFGGIVKKAVQDA